MTGWNSTPYDEPCYCEVCWGDVDSDQCVCPVCLICKEQGNPCCYMGRKNWWSGGKYYSKRLSWVRRFLGHGLIRLPRQVRQMGEIARAQQEELE